MSNQAQLYAKVPVELMNQCLALLFVNGEDKLHDQIGEFVKKATTWAEVQASRENASLHDRIDALEKELRQAWGDYATESKNASTAWGSYHATEAEASRMAKVLDHIAYKPIGDDMEASDSEVLRLIVEMARAAIAKVTVK